MTEIESRIAELVAQFRQVGATQMRDLPIYNPCLDVEAVGFQSLGECWVGVLITPWFMSAILLPSNKTTLGSGTLGRTSLEVLPSATLAFMSGEIETVGGYKSLSLHSPMSAFTSQEDARREARVRLTALLTPSPGVPKDAPPTPNCTPQPAPDRRRRAFLGAIRTACRTNVSVAVPPDRPPCPSPNQRSAPAASRLSGKRTLISASRIESHVGLGRSTRRHTIPVAGRLMVSKPPKACRRHDAETGRGLPAPASSERQLTNRSGRWRRISRASRSGWLLRSRSGRSL